MSGIEYSIKGKNGSVGSARAPVGIPLITTPGNDDSRCVQEFLWRSGRPWLDEGGTPKRTSKGVIINESHPLRRTGYSVLNSKCVLCYYRWAKKSHGKCATLDHSPCQPQCCLVTFLTEFLASNNLVHSFSHISMVTCIPVLLECLTWLHAWDRQPVGPMRDL